MTKLDHELLGDACDALAGAIDMLNDWQPSLPHAIDKRDAACIAEFNKALDALNQAYALMLSKSERAA